MSFHITFHKMSIRNQMKTIVILMLALFVLVCALISVSIRALIRRSEDEHMQVATQRLIDQMDLMYGKMENFCINIGEDDAIQALLASDYAQMSPLRRPAMECLARHKVLESTIEDISLVNDKIHYSNVLRGENLDRIRAMVNGRPFRWIGFCSHSFTSEAEKPDMMVYAGDVIVGTQNLGTIVISLNAADFLAEKTRCTSSLTGRAFCSPSISRRRRSMRCIGSGRKGIIRSTLWRADIMTSAAITLRTWTVTWWERWMCGTWAGA